MKPKRVAVLCALVLLCLPAAVCAYSKPFSHSVARRVVGNSTDSIVGATVDSSATEQSIGPLLLIGLALIGGASLISVKIGRSGSAVEAESTEETTILLSSTRSPRAASAPSIMRTPAKTRRATPAMEPVQIRQ